MSIASITLNNFRSYDSAAFEFNNGVSIIVGPNASGKTNLLEAVYMLAKGSSFRVSDKDIIKNECNWTRIDGMVGSQERTLKLEPGTFKTKKTFVIDGSEQSRLKFEDTVPIVLFEPDDIRFIGGSPERRRRFLDDVLSQTNHTYKRTLLTYQKALKQRNTLLKIGTDVSTVFAWNIILARAAGELVNARRELVAALNTSAQEIYSSIADKSHTLEFVYDSSIDSDQYSNQMLRKLEHSFDRDRERGYTSVGPHRDDLLMIIDGQAVSLVASRGEVRTITLALKIIEMKLVELARGIKPILLLDDVFSELDGRRRRSLTEFLDSHQTIITTTDADVVGKQFTKLAQIISL